MKPWKNAEGPFTPCPERTEALLGLRGFKLSCHKRAAGQASIEFMAVVSIALVIFTFYAPVSWNRENLIKNEREDLLAWRTAINVKKEINLANAFGPGYSRNFTLPERLISSNYTMTVINQSLVVLITWGGKNIVEQITTPNVTSNPKPGKNKIINDGGVIRFE